jgi:hypothetical protein
MDAANELADKLQRLLTRGGHRDDLNAALQELERDPPVACAVAISIVQARRADLLCYLYDLNRIQDAPPDKLRQLLLAVARSGDPNMFWITLVCVQ